MGKQTVQTLGCVNCCTDDHDTKDCKRLPIAYGDLDPQQRLDVARGEKLGVDGLERYYMEAGDGPGVYPEKDKAGEWCLFDDAQRLLSQRDQTIASLRQHKNDYMDAAEVTRKALVAELAQRDAEVERLWADRKTDAALIHELRTKLHALESQQAASVGGEREAFDTWLPNYYTDSEDSAARAGWVAATEYCRAALSPAGGGVVMPERKTEADFPGYIGSFAAEAAAIHNAALDEVAGLNAKPHCATCNDNGRIGGTSFYAPDEGGEP